jgi:hypothetical protein
MVENNCELGKVKKNYENGNFKLQSFPYVKLKISGLLRNKQDGNRKLPIVG